MSSTRTICKLFAVLLLTVILSATAVLVATASAAGATPVLSVADYKVVPYLTASGQAASSPLMPGDSGTVAVTITNTLKASTTNTTVHSDTITSNYFDSTHQTPGTVQTMADQKTSVEGSSEALIVESVSLIAGGPVEVTTGPYLNTGRLGTGDSARFEFGIKADSAAPDGTYELTLKVRTSDDDVYLNYPIRVQVDHTEPRLIVSKYAEAFNTSANEMSLDVANPRKNSIEAVSIEASGNEFVFEPQEFFVGTLAAGDTYTADFRVGSRQSTYTTSPRFTMVYKNGDNWHSTTPVTAVAHAYPEEKGYWENVWDNWWPYIVAGVLCLLALAFFVRVVAPKLQQKRGH